VGVGVAARTGQDDDEDMDQVVRRGRGRGWSICTESDDDDDDDGDDDFKVGDGNGDGDDGDGMDPLLLSERYAVAVPAFVGCGKEGYSVFPEGELVWDSEVCPILPTLVRNHLSQLNCTRNLDSASRPSSLAPPLSNSKALAGSASDTPTPLRGARPSQLQLQLQGEDSPSSPSRRAGSPLKIFSPALLHGLQRAASSPQLVTASQHSPRSQSASFFAALSSELGFPEVLPSRTRSASAAASAATAAAPATPASHARADDTNADASADSAMAPMTSVTSSVTSCSPPMVSSSVARTPTPTLAPPTPTLAPTPTPALAPAPLPASMRRVHSMPCNSHGAQGLRSPFNATPRKQRPRLHVVAPQLEGRITNVALLAPGQGDC
jgi:hypothetical protein